MFDFSHGPNRQLHCTNPYRMPETKQIFETDSQKPLIGSLSRVVEHPHKNGQSFPLVGTNAAFLLAVNTTSQPVNWSRTVSQVVYTTRELGTSRDFPNFDLHL